MKGPRLPLRTSESPLVVPSVGADLLSAAVLFHGQQPNSARRLSGLSFPARKVPCRPTDATSANISIPSHLAQCPSSRMGPCCTLWGGRLVLLNDTSRGRHEHSREDDRGSRLACRSTCTIGDVLGATIVGGKRLRSVKRGGHGADAGNDASNAR